MSCCSLNSATDQVLQYIRVYYSTSEYIGVHQSTSEYIGVHQSTSEYIGVHQGKKMGCLF